MKRRILSIITALALCLSLCPTWALAAEADPSLCKHHPAHTADCGYTAPTEGHDCGHQHTAACYTLGVLPDADSGDPYEVGGDTENLLDCHHSHDSECGYVQADPGTPCGYECRICLIEALIAALPEQVTADNAADVRARLNEILALYRELTEAEQGQLDLSRIYALQGALDGANDPDPIAESVTYQEAAWNSGVTYTTQTADSCTPVTDSTTAWNAGWYVVNGTVTVSEPITVTGAVNLILADGCTLNAEKGIVVTTDNSLTIYAQSGGTGTLNATGVFFLNEANYENNASAGIGGSGTAPDSGAITIHGGVINATGGGQSIYYGGAGIGGGSPKSGNGGNSGAIIIYGGTVTANSGEGIATGAGIGSGGRDTGGAGSNITIYGGSVTAASTGTQSGGAGIGGGGGSIDGGTGESINIYGGTVNATGGNKGAGIGGGSGSLSNTSGSGTNITISGGTVTAVGGNYAAGIGGGGGYYYSNQYTSGGCTGGTGSVTISGGIVDASSPADVLYSDYKGAPIGNGGNTTATATVSKTNAIVFENGAGTVCGAVTLDGSYTVPGDYTLNIPVGASLSGSGTLSGGSAFTTENLTEDMISVPEDWYYTGEDRTADIETKLSGELDKGITICGQTFTVSGWTLAVEKAADSDLTYTATYTNNSDNAKTVQKTITLLQSGTDLTDGKVKTYNGETETTSFTAGDTIKVVAKPTPTGAAPTNSAMFAASFTAPGAGQMAVFVSDTQVSAPVGVGADGTYTMEVSAADVLLAAGGPGTEIPLTAKFVENDNMADGAGTATVNITAVAVAEKDGKVIGYYGESNLDDAFTNDSATVTLLANVERTNTLNIKVNCTLDLGGHNITFTGTENVWVQGLVTAMTIRGEGEIISEQGHALVVTGSVTLEGGTFTSNGENCAGVYVNSAGASLSVTGEYVTIRNTGGGYGLAVNYAQSVQLSAGTYKGEKAVSIVSGTTTLGDLLDGGCAYHSGDTPIALEAGGKELTGTVTVKACQHTGEGVCTYTHNENTSTHTKTCLACGYTETGDCGFEKTADPTADSHTGQCPDCKRDRSGAHSFSDWAGNPVARTCTVCGYEQTAVARVEKDSTTTYVGALANAFTEGNSGATVTLLSEVDLGNNYIGIRGSSTFTLDLNGQTVKASHYGAFDISGGSLTIQDSGTSGKIESSNITIKVTGGTLSIKSGTVSGFYGVQITSGTVNISGGAISGTENGLLVNGGGNIVLSGGAYSGRHAIWVDANVSVTLKDLLATGYAYHQNDIPVAKAVGFVGDDYEEGEVPLDATPAWLTGTVTVKECNHTGGLVPSENGYQHGGPCKCCGAELTAANHTLGADNQCSGCGAALAAKVEKSGSDTVYVEASGLDDVFAEDSGNDGATITLLDNITTRNQITVGADNLTLDLNGKTYTCTQNDFYLSFVSLTIKGSGAITTSGYYCLAMNGGTLNIESGSFSAKDSAVYVENGGTLQLTGGSFTGNQNAIAFNSGEVTAALANYGGAGAPHYAFYQGSSPYAPSGKSLPSGTFTVGTCEHDGVPVQDLGGGKHGLTCPYCGYHSEHTTTLTAAASGNTVTFRGGCESCDYRAETLATAAFTFPKLTYGQTGQTVSCTWEHPGGYSLMVQIDSGEELQLDVTITRRYVERITVMDAETIRIKFRYTDVEIDRTIRK